MKKRVITLIICGALTLILTLPCVFACLAAFGGANILKISDAKLVSGTQNLYETDDFYLLLVPSDSMSPAFSKGDLISVEKATVTVINLDEILDYHVGNIIVYASSEEGVYDVGYIKERDSIGGWDLYTVCGYPRKSDGTSAPETTVREFNVFGHYAGIVIPNGLETLEEVKTPSGYRSYVIITVLSSAFALLSGIAVLLSQVFGIISLFHISKMRKQAAFDAMRRSDIYTPLHESDDEVLCAPNDELRRVREEGKTTFLGK